MLVLLALGVGVAGTAAGAQGRPDLVWAEAGHSREATGLDISPDGAMLATSSGDSTLKLWRYPHRRLLRTLVLPYRIDGQVMEIRRVRFTPDGAYAVAAVNQYDGSQQGSGEFGTVRVFRVSDGALVRSFGRQSGSIAAIDISPDATWVATAGDRGGVMVWQLADGQLVKSLGDVPGAAADVHFAPTGGRLCAGYGNGHVASWKTGGWQLAWDVKAQDSGVTQAPYSPDGTLVATTSVDGAVRLFDAADGAVRFAMPTGTPLRAAVFSPDGHALATGGADGAIRLWDVASGGLTRQFDGTGDVVSLRYSGDGQVLLSGVGYPAFRVLEWNPADGTRRRSFTRLGAQVQKVAYSPDSAWVAVAATYDERVDVFDAASGRLRFAWKTGANARDVAFSPNGRLVATPGPDNTVLIRRLSDGKTLRTLVGHAEEITGLAFSHDGALLASGSFFPGTIRLWRTSDWALVRQIDAGFDLGAFGPFASLAFSPDDQLLGSSAEAAPLVLKVSDGTPVAHPPNLSYTVAFSPDGQLFATSGFGSQDQVRLFRTSDWALAATLPTGAGDVAFSADGSLLLAAQADALRLWRTADWTVAKAFDQELGYIGSVSGVKAVAWSSDGLHFAYGRDDAAVAVARSPVKLGAGQPQRP
ncbi:MAG: WD40 repeat domain-containing protein [Burkholderiaceae bacterium]